MHRFLFYAVLLFLLTAFVPGEIEWSTARRLTWNDYTATANSKSKFSALSDCAISFKTAGQNDTVRVEVRTLLYPGRSWVKQKDKSDYLLSHEQLHFDITEWYARKFRKELSGMKITAANAQKKLTSAYRKMFSAYTKTQRKYDAQTKHSLNKARQEAWIRQVKKELDKLSRYSSPVVRMKISP